MLQLYCIYSFVWCVAIWWTYPHYCTLLFTLFHCCVVFHGINITQVSHTSTADGYSFLLETIMNRDAMNTLVVTFWCRSICTAIYLRVKLLGLGYAYVQFQQVIPNSFSKQLCQFIFRPALQEFYSYISKHVSILYH